MNKKSLIVLLSFNLVCCPLAFAGADGKDDILVYRPSNSQIFSGITGSDGILSINGSSLAWGGPAWDTLTGDVNGDGIDDLIGRNRETGEWRSGISDANGLTNTGSSVMGPLLAGDKPLIGDLNGDGKVDLLVYRQDNGEWFSSITNSDGTLQSFPGTGNYYLAWGSWQNDPYVGDIDGDGRTDLLLYAWDRGRWVVGYTGTNGKLQGGGVEVYGPFLEGIDVPMVGDVSGDGKDDIVIYRPENGEWFSGITTAAGAVSFAEGSYLSDFGGNNPSDSNVGIWDGNLGDVNGDGKADLVVRRRETGEWRSGITDAAGAFTAVGSFVSGWLLEGDIPLTGDVGAADVLDHCGEPGTVYLAVDLNTDCYVNLGDLAVLATKWLWCTDPANPACDQYW